MSDSDDGSSDQQPLELDIDNFGRPHGVEGKLNYDVQSFAEALCFADDKSYETLVADCEAAFTARAITGDGRGAEYSSGSTFFLPANMEPRCLLESLAKSIFDYHTRNVTDFDADRSGAEWWTLVLSAGESTKDINDDVSFHWDRDYGLESEYRVNLHPHIATVTYLSDIGAPTIVLDKVSPVRAGEDECGAGVIAEGFVSRPKRGKHISFDGRFLHGAVGDLGPVFSSSESIGDGETKGKKRSRSKKEEKRVTFLVNVWLNHKPMESEVYPETELSKFAGKSSQESKGAGTGVRFLLGRNQEETEKGVQKSDVKVISAFRDEKVPKKNFTEDKDVKKFSLTFLEAGREMTLKLPMPIQALQKSATDSPDASSFKVLFAEEGTAELEDNGVCRLIAGEEVESSGEEGEASEEGEDDDDSGEDEEEEEESDEEE